MAVDLETIWETLTERLETLTGDDTVKTITRRPKMEYANEELPVVALLDADGTEDLVSSPDDPAPVWKLGGVIDIYARTVESDPSPTTQLNGLVAAVKECLEFDATKDAARPARVSPHYTTLAGRVRYLAITKVDKGAGIKTGQAVASLTVEMEALG